MHAEFMLHTNSRALSKPRLVSRRQQGFTLVELMLVVIIIGVLAAIVVPRLVGRTKQARIAATDMAIASVSTALESFELDLDRFPSTEEGLLALQVRPSGLLPEDPWRGPYLKKLPTDAWNREFVYRYPGEKGVDFDLISYGPDGREGSEDDIANYRIQ
jgi:general secretion pathway protein G